MSFEPRPEAFAGCQTAAASDDNWHVYNYAVGEIAGAIPFNIMDESKLSSFFCPRTEEDRPFADSNNVVETVQVEVHRLDEIYQSLRSEHRFARPFLKLDTQTFDLKVAVDAGDILKEFSAVLIEMGVKILYQDSPTMIESLKMF